MDSEATQCRLRDIGEQLLTLAQDLRDLRDTTPYETLPSKQRRILRAAQSVLTRKANLCKALAREIAERTATKPLPLFDQIEGGNRQVPTIGSKWG